MVSGIGPRATREGLGIPVVADLPGVGHNLWVCIPSTEPQDVGNPADQ